MIDIVAVGTYLLAGLPLIGIALQDAGLLNRKAGQEERLKVHAICIALFLVLAHIAMIAGMADPALLGYESPSMEHGHDMGGH